MFQSRNRFSRKSKLISTDKELVSAIISGDIKAFDQFFNKFHQSLFSFAFSILKDEDEAKEAVQLVFFKIWEKRVDLDPSLSIQSYLFTIALNITRKFYRDKLKEIKYKQELAIELEYNSTCDLSVIEYHNLLEYVDKIIAKIPPSRREIFILSKKEGLKHSEIAQKLNLSEQTVKNQIAAAKIFLRSEVQKDKNVIQSLYLYTN